MILVFCGDLAAQDGPPQPNAAAQDAPSQAPPPAVFANRIPAAQLAFLNDYVGKTTREVMKDKRFKALLKEMTPRTEYHYGRDMPLGDTIESMLGGTPLPVDIRDGRYATIGSSGGIYLSGRGFVWFDMQEGIALGGVYFYPVNGEPTPTLAVFSRQLHAATLGVSQLPAAFQQDMEQWSTLARVPMISVRYFIPENGKKYVLLHDEDYCSPSDAAAQMARCQQMDADAADADMNGAYFMKEVHNAANGTAWMLSPEQVAWIGVRDRTCGGALGCRIVITRRRTRALLGN